MTREKIEDIRFIVIPFVVNILKGINYEGQGDSDAKEFIDDFNVIFDLAIKALEQEPTTKNDYHRQNIQSYMHDFGVSEEQAEKELRVTTKNDLEVDAISRRSVIKEMEKRYAEGDYITKGFINSLPSVTPIRPKGHWICDGKGRSFADYHCSECGLKLALCGQDIKQRQDSGYSLFCGGCGADMREVKE